MKVPFLPKAGFCLIVALSLTDIGCVSSPAPVSPKTKNPTVNHQKEHRSVGGQLVGIWQGFWSLKGRVATDRFLFLEDGRWGWLATTDTKVANTIRPVQRSGRWEMGEDVIVLTELRRKEFVGCKRDSSSDQTCENTSDCEPCSAEYRVIRHDTPVVERLTIGECPDNQEAKMLDQEYTCLSFGERVFWRKATPTKRERDRFFEGE